MIKKIPRGIEYQNFDWEIRFCEFHRHSLSLKECGEYRVFIRRIMKWACSEARQEAMREYIEKNKNSHCLCCPNSGPLRPKQK